MSISKRLIDLAKANLNALLEKAAGEGPLAELSDEELEAELQRRRQRRLQENEERRDREAAERAARMRAAERAAAQKNARQPPPSSRNAPPPSASRGAPKPPPRQQARRPPPPPAPPGSERRLRELYASLEVPYGAGFDEVKKSFRRLMRKYHPDLHVANPAMHKTATQLTMSLTQAYNELELHLVGGRRG